MKKEYSISDARRLLPAVVRSAERGRRVVLQRRGIAVAVVLSMKELERLERASGRGVVEAWRAYRAAGSGVELSDKEIAEWRSDDLGREVDLH